jgi:hypothetical protein
MMLLPRFIQTLVTAISDVYYYKLARYCSSCCFEHFFLSRVGFSRWCLNSRYATTSLLIHLFSWFGTYCLCRTLGNSMEHAFLIMGTYFLCRRKNQLHFLYFSISYFSIAIWIAALSVFVRPTIATLWVRHREYL